MRDFLNLGTLMACALLVCFVVAVVSVHFMRLAANRRLPDAEKISYFLPFNKWDKIIDSYRRLYPRGRLYPILEVAVIGTAAFGIGTVLAVIWKLAAAK